MPPIKLTFVHAGAGTVYKKVPKYTKILGMSFVPSNSGNSAVLSKGSEADKTAPDAVDAICALNASNLYFNFPFPLQSDGNYWVSSVAAGAGTDTIVLWGV